VKAKKKKQIEWVRIRVSRGGLGSCRNQKTLAKRGSDVIWADGARKGGDAGEVSLRIKPKQASPGGCFVIPMARTGKGGGQSSVFTVHADRAGSFFLPSILGGGTKAGGDLFSEGERGTLRG